MASALDEATARPVSEDIKSVSSLAVVFESAVSKCAATLLVMIYNKVKMQHV